MEVAAIFLVLLMIAFIVGCAIEQITPQIHVIEYVVQQDGAVETPINDGDEAVVAESKDALMALGIPAKSAIAMLEGTSGTVEERVKQALTRR